MQMHHLRIIPLTGLFVAALSAPSVGRDDCPVTLASESPVTPPWNSSGDWYGSESLAVHLPPHGKWKGLGSGDRFRDKLWFWRRGYDSVYEARPHLVLEGRKLSGDVAERVRVDKATNGQGTGWDNMLMMVEFPSAGCWRVNVTYLNAGIEQELTFVVDVGDH
jgi:hypothetical protein